MTGNNPRYAVLVPGADSLTFEEDQAEAARRDIEARELTLPHFSGHPIDDREAHFHAVANLFDDTIETIRDQEPGARIAAVGRNNGGGQLAWALARKIAVNAVVLVGAIPEISLYRKQSNSASAVKFRQSLANAIARTQSTNSADGRHVGATSVIAVLAHSVHEYDTRC